MPPSALQRTFLGFSHPARFAEGVHRGVIPSDGAHRRSLAASEGRCLTAMPQASTLSVSPLPRQASHRVRAFIGFSHPARFSALSSALATTARFAEGVRRHRTACALSPALALAFRSEWSHTASPRRSLCAPSEQWNGINCSIPQAERHRSMPMRSHGEAVCPQFHRMGR